MRAAPKRAPRLASTLAIVLALAITTAQAFAATATNVFSSDFESGLPAEFSAPGSVIEGVQGYAGLGPAGNTFGGNFLRYTSVPLFDTKLTLANLPSHTAINLSFLLAVIDSWDGTELMQVAVDGTTLWSHWFQLATGDASSYVAPPGALLSSGVNLGFTAGSFYEHDRAYDLSVDPVFMLIPHTASSVEIVWRLSAVSGPAAAQWQGGSDESWAIENVRVETVGEPVAAPPPSPESPGLALAGTLPNPSRDGRLRVRFSLPSSEPAMLELFDVSGRRIDAREVGNLGPGGHSVDLSADRALPDGVYLIRLTHAGNVRTSRAAVVR
jgi:hypothetical protein